MHNIIGNISGLVEEKKNKTLGKFFMWIMGIAMMSRKVTEKLPDHEGSSNFPQSDENFLILYEKKSR